MDVKYRLSEFIKSRNIQQKDIASLLGVTPATISGIIKGKSEITTAQIIILGKKFKDLDIRWLLIGEKSEFKQVKNIEDKSKAEEVINRSEKPCPCCEKLKAEKMKLLEDLREQQEKYIHLLETGIPKKEESTKIGA